MKVGILVLALFAPLAAATAQQASPGSMLHGSTVAVSPIPPEVLTSDAYKMLVTDLRGGGFVIYLRHAVTSPTPEPVVKDLADCSWQRLLSADGKRQAAAVGARLAELRVPVTVLEASPFCRTRETAKIAFNRAPVINGDLLYHSTQTPEKIAAANARLKARFAVPPSTGANIVLVGHSPTMKEAGGIELPEGQAAIVKPAGDGTFRIVARLSEAGIMPQP